MRYRITPVPKCRQTRSDKWKKRPCVMRYRSFADEVRQLGITVNPCGDLIIFYLPMPTSWSKQKKKDMDGTPHRQKPDIDNLLKALLDAVFYNDSHIYDIHPIKRWAYEGSICISREKS